MHVPRWGTCSVRGAPARSRRSAFAFATAEGHTCCRRSYALFMFIAFTGFQYTSFHSCMQTGKIVCPRAQSARPERTHFSARSVSTLSYTTTRGVTSSSSAMGCSSSWRRRLRSGCALSWCPAPLRRSARALWGSIQACMCAHWLPLRAPQRCVAAWKVTHTFAGQNGSAAMLAGAEHPARLRPDARAPVASCRRCGRSSSSSCGGCRSGCKRRAPRRPQRSPS